ncbi:hypothetical protein NKJ10_26880 [Mesorhizobium sp. M0204]|uniref:hypothetical protein n=1 Tax=Mesorhizobium sp. M0204 TaxID=2956913 RepID=UPI0033369815
MIGIIIIGSVGAVGMIHVFVTLIIIIVAADQVSDCLPLLTRLSPVEFSPRWPINRLLVGMAETESQAAQATEHVQRPFQSAPALSGFVTSSGFSGHECTITKTLVLSASSVLLKTDSRSGRTRRVSRLVQGTIAVRNGD